MRKQRNRQIDRRNDGLSPTANRNSGSISQLILSEQQIEFSGPLPPPSMLAQFEAITPGFADRIVAMAEKQQAHRHSQQGKLVDSEVAKNKGDIEITKRGQIFGLTIGLAVLLLSWGLAKIGSPNSGAAVAITDLAVLVGTFVYGRRKPEPEPESK